MARISSQRAYEDANELNLKRNIRVADLVQVIEFYPAQMRVDVKPLVKYSDGDSYLSYTPVLSVPVFCMSGGGYIIKPRYNKGDIGLVVYLDRDSDGTVITGGESIPNTERIHSGDDAVFIGGVPVGKKSFENFQANSFTISSDDGKTSIEVTQDGISIKGSKTTIESASVDITGNLFVRGLTNICGGLSFGNTEAAVQGNIHLTGHIIADEYIQSPQAALDKIVFDDMYGSSADIDSISSTEVNTTNLQANNITADNVKSNEAVINNIKFTGHTHSIEDGADTTGVPQ